MTRASIIVPAYNVAKFLPRCVESLLAQTEASIEVVVVNDGSSDGLTGDLADRLAEQDGRIRVEHQENGGLSAARNAGLRMATGDYVLFVDGDDWAEPDMVSSMIAACESAGAEVSVAGAHVDFHDGEERLVRSELRVLPETLIDRAAPIDSTLVTDNFVNLVGYAWNKAYLRSWLQGQAAFFEDGLTLIEDIEFNSRVIGAAARTALVPRGFVHYVQRPRQTLGTTHDRTFLVKRLRAIQCVDSLLVGWQLGSGLTAKLRARAASGALWAAARSCGHGTDGRARLSDMVEQPGARDLIDMAQADASADLRRRWVVAALRRDWFSVALMPAKVQLVLGQFYSSIRRATTMTPEGKKS